MRGRDIKKYGYVDSDLWLIYIPWHFPLHETTNINGASLEAEDTFQNEYPAIYTHLIKYKTQLSNRNKAETGIRYEWYALQRWGANYMDDFSKQKIMYPNMTKFLPFYIDTSGFMQNDKSFMIVGKNLYFLTAFLNSSLFKYCFVDNFPELQGGTREIRKIFFDKIPVIKVDESTENIFKELVVSCQYIFSKNEDSKTIEKKIDKMIFEMYGLSKGEQEEIGFIDFQ